MKRRFFAMLLSLAMLFTLAPTAFAAENGVKTEEELQAAIQNATEGESIITLSADIGLTSTLEIPANKRIEIQGDGHSIYRAESWTNNTPTTPANILDIKGSLTSHNLTIDAKCSDEISGFRTVSVSGSFQIYDTTIQNGNTLPNGGGANVLLAVQGSSFVMNSGLIQNGRGKNSGGVFAYGGGSGCTFTMNGGEISNNIGTWYGSGVILYNGTSKGYFNGGKIVNNTTERALTPDSQTGRYTYDDKWGGALWVNASDSAYISGELEMYGNKAVYTHSDNTTKTVNEFDIFCTASANGASSPIILSELKNTLRICTPQGPSDEQKYSLVRGTTDYQLTYDDLAKLELKKLDVSDPGQVFYLDKTDNTVKIANAVNVTLHANNGTDDSIIQKVPQGKSVLLKANPFTKSGYIFVGWNSAQNGTGDSYKVDIEQTFNQNKELYAQWTPDSGFCGAQSNKEHVTWKLTANKEDPSTYTLTISGDGAMADYSCNITRNDATQPWRESQTGVAPSAISKVVVGSGVTNIGMFACNGLNHVKEYDIAATVQTISSWGIDTQSVETFTLNGNENFIVDEDGVLMNAAKDTMIAYPGGRAAVDIYEVPDSVKTLASGVFVGSQIDKIVIPNTVESVAAWSFSASTAKEVVFDVNVQTLPKGMFSGMTNLTQLTFGEHAKIEEIANAALSGLNSIKTFDLPASLKKIGEMSLGQNTSMTELTLPDGLEEIGAQAFKAIGGVEGNLSKLTFGKKMPKMTNGNSSCQILLGQKKLDAVDMTRCTSEVDSIDCFNNRGYDGIPVVYTANKDVAAKAKTANNDLMAYAVANGGTFPADTKFEAGKLATPVMDGYKFDGWYENENCTGTAVTAPTAGKIYYAKWTAKQSQEAPVAPTLKDRTYTSITLYEVADSSNGVKAEYSKDGGKTWQDSPEFTDLTSGTTYTFAVRYAETDTYNASEIATADFATLRHSSGSSSSNPTYSVTTPSKSENGGVAVSSKNARKGDTVTVTVTPDAGYQLDKLTVTDKNGNVLKLTDKGDGKYSFTMPDGKVEVKAVFAKKVETSPFDDVSADAYYNKAVQWAQEKGITDGISSNLFGPKQPCTRSQIVTFLWRAAGSPEPKGTAAGMTDVVPGSYYAKAVAWAVENGITTGTAEGTFSPDATCTRAQAVTFLARAQNAKATGKTAFSDVPADSYFADAVAWAQANGVTTGTTATTFSPDSDCTRAQIVTFLYRANQGT